MYVGVTPSDTISSSVSLVSEGVVRASDQIMFGKPEECVSAFFDCVDGATKCAVFNDSGLSSTFQYYAPTGSQSASNQGKCGVITEYDNVEE